MMGIPGLGSAVQAPGFAAVPGPLPSPAAMEQVPVGLGQTMIGGPGFATAQAAPATSVTEASHAPLAFGGTMVGIPNPAGLAGMNAPIPGAPGAAAPAHPQTAPAQAARAVKGTMMGIAMPGVAPAQSQVPTGPVVQHRPLKGTVMGVAVPGIAPTHEKLLQEDFVEPMAPSLSQYQVPEFQAPPPPPKRARIPKAAMVLGAVGLTLGAGAALVGVLWKSPEPMTATAGLDASGADVLHIACESCPPETKVILGPTSAHFNGGKASLVLKDRLKVGDNKFVVAIERPGMARDENIELVVPLNFRIAGDLSGLTADPPVLAVAVDAVAGASVVVDGKAVELQGGHGRHVVDISEKTKGASATIVPLELKVPYTVTLPSGKRDGSVELKVGIAPLFIEAPGPATVVDTEHFTLAGKSMAGAMVKVAGNPITVDPKGLFAQLYRVDSEGETTISVQAIAKDHAPRTAEVRIKRVATLQEEAKVFLKDATTSYSSIQQDPDSKKGLPVALAGTVEELRVDHQTTVLLVNVSSGCTAPPCLLRLIHSARTDVTKGDKVSAFGHLAGAVAGPFTQQKVPEVRVSFLIRGEAL